MGRREGAELEFSESRKDTGIMQGMQARARLCADRTQTVSCCFCSHCVALVCGRSRATVEEERRRGFTHSHNDNLEVLNSVGKEQ